MSMVNHRVCRNAFGKQRGPGRNQSPAGNKWPLMTSDIFPKSWIFLSPFSTRNVNKCNHSHSTQAIFKIAYNVGFLYAQLFKRQPLSRAVEYNGPIICLTTNLVQKCQEPAFLGKSDHLPSCHPSSNILIPQPSEQHCSWSIPICSAKFSVAHTSPHLLLIELTTLQYCCMSSHDKTLKNKDEVFLCSSHRFWHIQGNH